MNYSYMFNLRLNILSVFLLIFHEHYCTPTHEHPISIGQSVAGGEEEENTNATYHRESDSGHVSNSDNNVHKSIRSTQQDFLSCCSEAQPRLLDGYYYKFDLPSNRQFSNHIDIVSAGYAYLLAFDNNVLKKPHRYFDIDDFINKSGIVFPPTLPLVCYDTGYSLHESPLFNYGREHLLRDLTSAEGAPPSQSIISSSATRLSATRHLNPNSGYMVQRRKIYRDLGNLLQNLRRGQKERLRTKCSETIFSKTTDLIIELLGDNTIQAMSPDYSLEQFNEVAKLFLGDIIAYEMIRQACKAVCITEHSVRFPEITAADWTPVAEKLCTASNAVRHNWHVIQLQKDVNKDEDYLQLVRPLYENDFIISYSNKLMQKYDEYGFRVTIHSGWTAAEAKIICNGAQNLKCIDIDNAMVLIRWKSLKPAGLAASFDMPQQHRKFPIVQPPAPSHKFSGLYLKVQTALSKLQNAVDLLRVTHLQNRFYKQASDLFRAFDSGSQPDIYAETAEEFAKSLDSLYVFKTEYQPLLETLSEVVLHTGEEGIDIVWVLIDRSFYEMQFYMADIEEHMMQLRQEVVNKSTAFRYTNAVRKLLLGNYSEELSKIRNALSQYLTDAHFYTNQGNNPGATEVLKNFIDNCNPVKHGISNIRSSLMFHEIRQVIPQMGGLSPFYIYILSSVTSYDMTSLAIYSLFCASQKYRWISVRNLGLPQTRMPTPDIQQFLNSTLKDVVDISDALNVAAASISEHVYKSQFYWIENIPSALEEEERRTPESDAGAQRIADKLNRLFPWASFFVVLMKGDWKGYTFENGEKMFYYKFFVNPDYSLFHIGSEYSPNMIVNWSPKKRSSEIRTNAQRFGFSVDSEQLCEMPSSALPSFLKNYENIKSFFVWRNYIGQGLHYQQQHTVNHDTGEARPVVDEPCCYKSGTSYGTTLDSRVCWYKHDVQWTIIQSVCEGRSADTCHVDDKAAIYVLGNVGEDY